MITAPDLLAIIMLSQLEWEEHGLFVKQFRRMKEMERHGFGFPTIF
jgi:hypothetical protein